MSSIDEELDYLLAIADWLLDLADENIEAGKLDEALKYVHVASRMLASQNRDLVSVRVESVLRRVSSILADQGRIRIDADRSEQPVVCLHVLSNALPAGGLTAMASRWISRDSFVRVHSVALLAQHVSIPESFRRAVENAGGRIYQPSPTDSFADKAVWLRRLAEDEAHCVVLHVDSCDVICATAFGVNGGPPVLIVNHAAHAYWNGASIADQIVNCRGSELEVLWSAMHRGAGASKCSIVPIPLLEPQFPPSSEHRLRIRQELGIADHAVVILTVGAEFKYLPMNGLDFLAIWEGILKQVPDAVLLAVGFNDAGRWQEASQRVGGRIRTLGTVRHEKLSEIHFITDLYIDGFPFGTTTSLLEAGAKAIPVVLSPMQAPAPFGTDGIALDTVLQRAATVSDYEAHVVALCQNRDQRATLGRVLRNSIADHHFGEGWRAHLEAALAAVPSRHNICELVESPRTPVASYIYWSTFLPSSIEGYDQSLETAIRRAQSLALSPRSTQALRRACQRYMAVRKGKAVPFPIVNAFLQSAARILPSRWLVPVFRSIAFVCRKRFLVRTLDKLASRLGFRRRQVGGYDDYQYIDEKART